MVSKKGQIGKNDTLNKFHINVDGHIYDISEIKKIITDTIKGRMGAIRYKDMTRYGIDITQGHNNGDVFWILGKPSIQTIFLMEKPVSKQLYKQPLRSKPEDEQNEYERNFLDACN